jgi:hypothetical protein
MLTSLFKFFVTTSGGSIINGWNATPFFGKDYFSTFEGIISVSIAIITVIAGIWFIYLIIIGGIEIMTAGDNKNAVEGARKKISTGAVGLVIVVAGLFIAGLIGIIFGIDVLNPGGVLRNLKP